MGSRARPMSVFSGQLRSRVPQRAFITRSNKSPVRVGAFTRSSTYSPRAPGGIPYRHKALAKGEIRLLRPLGTGRERKLRFSIESYPLGEAPPYTALSYTWGREPPAHNITLNKLPFHVRENLWDGLHHLTSLAQWDHVWVDAICIDQSNIAERNAQVQMIDRIFEKATLVTAWLGLPHEDTHDILANKLPQSDDFALSEHFADVANRPYWTRMWVVQELLLAREVQLLIGKHTFDLDYFKSLTLADYGGRIRMATKAQDLIHALPILHSRDPDRLPQWSQPLYDLLLRYRRSQCADPRDKIFSLLNLIPQREYQILDAYFPDYALSYDEVHIITLSFLRTVSKRQVQVGSNALFDAFGVQSIDERQRLLSLSRGFDSRMAAAAESSAVAQDVSSMAPEAIDVINPSFKEYTRDELRSQPSRRESSRLRRASVRMVKSVLRILHRTRPESRTLLSFALIAASGFGCYMWYMSHA